MQAIWDICELRCRVADRRVGVIINHDRFRINQDMYDAYAEMGRHFLANFFSQTSRHASSASPRAKLGEAFSASTASLPLPSWSATMATIRGMPTRSQQQ
ncbi:MAG: hypothetical protein V5B60_18410 [Accumulibacter sp.]|uniref:hypothetical protein n=1 Tax=Accumulibacter sp. TaxID=2053492 RepID=UPI002FC35C81